MTINELRSYDGLIRLSHKVVLYVPSESNGQPLANRQSILNHVLSTLSNLCGGATATDGLGYWVGNSGLVRERVTLAFAYCDNLDSIIEQVLDLAQWVKANASQESVAIEIDNELYLI